jgi:hypothetical protein
MAAVLPASRVVFLVIAVVTILGWSVPYVELYRLSGSIWPCVLMHSVEDAFVNPLVISGFVGIAAGRELLVSPVLGLFNLALYILVGLAIRAYRIHRVAAASGQALSA